MNEVFSENNIALPLESQQTIKDEDRYTEGLKIQEPIYGTEILDKYSYLPDEYAKAIPRFLTELGFGDFATRGGMDGTLRELLILVALSALGGADLQVYSHALGAIKVGNSKETIICALLHAMPYMGFPRMLNALNAIKPVIKD